jgi:Domain of unknown function (DUF4189)
MALIIHFGMNLLLVANAVRQFIHPVWQRPFMQIRRIFPLAFAVFVFIGLAWAAVADDSKATPVPGSVYGAVAFDQKTASWGLSDFSKDEDSAKKSAMKYCAERGKACEIVKTVHNSCASVASGNDGVVTWSDNPIRESAQETAVASCQKRAGNSCSIQRTVCYIP